MFKPKSFEIHNHKSSIEKIALFTAFGGAVVALAVRISSRIPSQSLEMLGGQLPTTNIDNPGNDLLNTQHTAPNIEEHPL